MGSSLVHSASEDLKITILSGDPPLVLAHYNVSKLTFLKTDWSILSISIFLMQLATDVAASKIILALLHSTGVVFFKKELLMGASKPLSVLPVVQTPLPTAQVASDCMTVVHASNKPGP
jgi:hypothetical protein